MTAQPKTFECPIPLVAPFGAEVNAACVQDVWDTFVKPHQEADEPQSVEMRILMAILRAVYAGLSEVPDESA